MPVENVQNIGHLEGEAAGAAIAGGAGAAGEAKTAEEPKAKRFGSSQEPVLEYVKANPSCTAQEVGDALYAEHSAYGKWGEEYTKNPSTRRRWAYQILRALEKRGVISSRPCVDSRRPHKGRRPMVYSVPA